MNVVNRILNGDYSDFGVPTLSQLMNDAWIMDAEKAANNGTPQSPQKPKSPLRKQCEANAENKYQNTFNAIDNSFYRDAYKTWFEGGFVGRCCWMRIDL